MRSAAWVIGFALLAPPVAHCEELPLGRLFFTPEQRAALEEARRKNIRAEELAAQTAASPKAPRARDVVVNGVVMRSDGLAVIWVNGKAVENETEDGMRVSPTASRSSVVLRDPGKGRALRLKVGQRADLLSGRVEENYEARRAAAHEEEAAREAGPKSESSPTAERRARKRASAEDPKTEPNSPSNADATQSDRPGQAPEPAPADGSARPYSEGTR